MTDRPPFRSWAEDYPHEARNAMPPIDREAFRIRAIQRAKSGKVRSRVARGAPPPPTNGGKITRALYDHRVCERETAEEKARQHRLTDQIERARLHLQRRGFVVVRASMFGGRPDQWDIAGRDRWISNDELLALAQRQGFTKEGNANASAD